MEERVQSRRPVNILLVDDQPAKLLTYEAILADMGENLIKANSGREALDCLLRTEIAVVLVDVCMPELDGFELTSMIRNHPRFQRTAVILVSGLFTEDVDRLKGYVSGAVDYVSVPIIPEILRAKVSVFADLFRKTEALEELNRQKLRESEERFRTMADTAPVMIWVSGPERQGLFFNRPWLEFTGGTLEEEQNAGWVAGVHPEDVERTSTIYSSAFEARRSFQMEFRLRRADGEYRWVVCNGAPRFAPDGVFGGYVGSCIDVSDIKRAQEEVLAGQRLESLGVLASGVAHDFNNMIGGIMANAELAMSEGSAEERNKHLHNIVSLTTHGGEIVRQLMTYGGVESQGAEPVSLSALVGEMIKLLNALVSTRVVLKADLDKTLPPVLANRSQLQQLVMNLVINASEAIGEGEGEVRIVTSRGKPRAQDRFPAGDYVRLEVADTGSGMTPDVQARMFDPFFTTKFDGRGLGLAVIQRLIKQHKGEINVKSTPREGTTFEILLPCADTSLKEKEIPAPGRAAGKQGERTKQTGKVLMVEDAAALRSAVSEGLRMQGFAVIEAGDGTAAVEEVRARADDIDIIVLDVILPGMHSWEVLREARRLRPGIKIILMSAYSRSYVR
jgi:PAS domain S-box-containing protein